MILRCKLLILIATFAISQAEFTEIECDFIETSDQGLQCEFTNVFMLDTTNVKVIERNRSIESVQFRQSELYSVPSDIFQKFPKLKHLDVDLTQIRIIKPDNFFNANELKYFLARFNEIPRLESETFTSCPQLKFLVLQHNHISSIHPRAFYGLSHLEALYLDYNRISVLPSGMLDHLPSLLHFSMAYNNLTSTPDDLLMKNNKLETLNLGHNLLTSFDDEQFDKLPFLERVQLDHNKLTELDLVACKSSEINIDNNNLREIQLNKWTKIVSAWGNPVNKLILHEHYGNGRMYNFSFNEVSEIVFFVHEHCCTVENLENFYILTLSFGDLSEKNFDVNDWNCKFRKNIGYNSDKGYVTNNVCVKNSEQKIEFKTTTTLPATTTSTPFLAARFSPNEGAYTNIKDDDSGEDLTERTSIINEYLTTRKSIFSYGFDFESTTEENGDEYKAHVEEFSTTESYEKKAEKGIWKTIKKKVGGWKNSAVNKWNNWFG